MENKLLNKAIQRIYKDLKEIQLNPIRGIALAMPDESNPFSLRANIYILDGIYKSVLLHMIISMPKNYPIVAPNMIIAPGQAFDSRFHHHVFGDINSGYKICIDLLNSGYFSEGAKTGWTPAYTLSTVLMQMQIFFSQQYDLHEPPPNSAIQELISQVRKFKTEVKLTDGSFAQHSYLSPFPKLNIEPEQHKVKKIDLEENTNVLLKSKEKIYDNFKCCLTKNSVEESDFFIGYPVNKETIENNTLYKFIPEILSFEGYSIQKDEAIKSKTSLRTTMGEEYSHFFPIYLKEDSYMKNKSLIYELLNSLNLNSDIQSELIIGNFLSYIESFFLLYERKIIHSSQKIIETMTHILRLMIRVIKDFPISFADMLKDSKIYSSNDLQTIIQQIFLNHLLKEPSSENLKDLIIQMISDQFSIYFSKILKNVNQVTLHLDDFYASSITMYNSIIFAQHFSMKFLNDLQSLQKDIDKNFGILNEKITENFLLELAQIIAKIQTFSQFFNYIGIGQQDIYGCFSIIYFKSFLDHPLNLIPQNSFFLGSLEVLIQIILGFIKVKKINVKIFNCFKNDNSHVYRFKRMSLHKKNPMGLPEKLSRIPKCLFELDQNILFYEKFLASDELLFFLICLQKDDVYAENPIELLLELNVDTQFKEGYKSNEEKIFLTFDSLIRNEISNIMGSLKKKNTILINKLCFYIRLYEKNRKVFPKLKTLLNQKTEEKNFSEFLIENVKVNFKEFKGKMKLISKKEDKLNDIELMLLFIGDDFKLLKTTDIIQRCLHYELLIYIYQNYNDLKEKLDDNDMLLKENKSEEIYQFLLNKKEEISCLDDILMIFYRFEEIEQAENFKFSILKFAETQNQMKRDEEIDFSRLFTIILEQKKGLHFVNKIDLLEKYLKKQFPYEFIYNLYNHLIQQPIISLNKYINNPNKTDHYMNNMLNEIYFHIKNAKILVIKEPELIDELIESIIIYDENEEIDNEEEGNEELLNFMILLNVTDQFDLYHRVFSEKIYKKYIKIQISLLWNLNIQKKTSFSTEDVKSFFKTDNIIDLFQKNCEDLNTKHFMFHILWSLNKIQAKWRFNAIEDLELIEEWRNEIKKVEEFDKKKIEGLLGIKEKSIFENLLKDLNQSIVTKFFRNLKN